MRIFGLIIERADKRAFANEMEAYDAGHEQGVDDCFDAIQEIEDKRSREQGTIALLGTYRNGRKEA